jgi:hypothetical protein
MQNLPNIDRTNRFGYTVIDLMYDLNDLAAAKLNNDKFGLIALLEATVRDSARKARNRIIEFAISETPEFTPPVEPDSDLQALRTAIKTGDNVFDLPAADIALCLCGAPLDKDGECSLFDCNELAQLRGVKPSTVYAPPLAVKNFHAIVRGVRS